MGLALDEMRELRCTNFKIEPSRQNEFDSLDFASLLLEIDFLRSGLKKLKGMFCYCYQTDMSCEHCDLISLLLRER